MDNEMNPAEREAEQILKAAVSSAHNCPMGEGCPVHFRVDHVDMDEPNGFAEIITYVGEFAVATCNNSDLSYGARAIRAVLGIPEQVFPRWETIVWHVGNGAMGDMGPTVEHLYRACRYRTTHDDWRLIQSTHNVVASAVEAGMLDLDTPWED